MVSFFSRQLIEARFLSSSAPSAIDPFPKESILFRYPLLIPRQAALISSHDTSPAQAAEYHTSPIRACPLDLDQASDNTALWSVIIS